jgi:hypothetical protein
MAELLDVSQEDVSDHERGELRLHGELLVKLARILKISTDEILRRFLRRLQDLDKVSRRDRDALMRTLEPSSSRPSRDRSALLVWFQRKVGVDDARPDVFDCLDPVGPSGGIRRPVRKQRHRPKQGAHLVSSSKLVVALQVAERRSVCLTDGDRVTFSHITSRRAVPTDPNQDGKCEASDF